MVYPTPEQVGIRVPRQLKQAEFNRGFEWALRGGQITQVEHLRQSFREGYRAAKLYLQEYRRLHNVPAFPMRARVALRGVA